MKESELEQLRQIILQDEQQRLDKLESQFGNAADRLNDVSSLLPGAIHRAAERDDTLTRALAKPIRLGVAEAIKSDAKGFADVLFPIMGPSIRRAIAESLKDFVQNLNNTISQSMSWRGMQWRIEAARKGVPFAEIVLHHTVAYRVQQALLIHADSGLVVSQAELADVVSQDSDAFSAMLTAIQDFVRDSFAGDNQLSTLDMGERTVWIIRGPHAHLACVISGVPGQKLRNHLADVVDEIHARFGDLLAEFNGDRSALIGVDSRVEACLDLHLMEDSQPKRPPIWPACLLGLSIVGACIWWAMQPKELSLGEKTAAVLHAQAGIHISRIQKQDQRWQIYGLRDSLAASPQDVLRNADIPSEQLDFHWTPFKALDEEIVLQRLQQKLALPEGVQLRLRDSVAYLQGQAPEKWIALIEQQLWQPEGVNRIDTTDLVPIRDLSELRAALPSGVSVGIEQNQLIFRGTAQQAWIAQLANWSAQYSDLQLAATQELQAQEWHSLASHSQALSKLHVYFVDADNLRSVDAQATLQKAANHIKQAQADSVALGQILEISVIGFSDGLGNKKRNETIRLLRAHKAIRELRKLGVRATLKPEAAAGYTSTQAATPSDRRVEFVVNTNSAAQP